MKTIIFRILALCVFSLVNTLANSQTLSTIGYLNKIKSVSLPFNETKICSIKESGFFYMGDSIRHIPYCTYDNLNLTQCSAETNKSVMRRFEQPNNTFFLTTLITGESDWQTYYVATMNSAGEIIDYVESGVIIYTSSTIAVKQYSISSDLKVTVYNLNVTSPLNVDPFNFTSVTAQRIDKVYQIDPTGHFIQTNQLTYQSKTYDKTYLEDMTKDIWNGNEVLIPTPGTLTMQPNYNIVTSNITNNGSNVSFSLVFYSNSVMLERTSYKIGTLSENCRPFELVSKFFESMRRMWTLNIYPNGDVYVKIVSVVNPSLPDSNLPNVSPDVPANEIVNTGVIKYNL